MSTAKPRTYTIRLYPEQDAALIEALDELAQTGPHGAQVDAIRKALRAWFLDDTPPQQVATQIDYALVRQIVQAAIQDEFSRYELRESLSDSVTDDVSSALDALGEGMFQ